MVAWVILNAALHLPFLIWSPASRDSHLNESRVGLLCIILAMDECRDRHVRMLQIRDFCNVTGKNSGEISPNVNQSLLIYLLLWRI